MEGTQEGREAAGMQHVISKRQTKNEPVDLEVAIVAAFERARLAGGWAAEAK